MTTYAIAHLRNVVMGPDIVAYVEAIDATLAPFAGRFLVHGDVIIVDGVGEDHRATDILGG
jgi:uncharacterized protein (DUF1330 family)